MGCLHCRLWKLRHETGDWDSWKWFGRAMTEKEETKSFLCTSLLRNTNPPKPVTWTAFLWCFMSLIGGFGDKEKTNPTSESCCLFTVCNIIRYGHYPKDGKLIKIAQSGHAIRKIRCVTTGCHQTLQPTENKKSKNPYNKMKDIEKYK